jgi:soluble lytic murein transglycosylase-like protein
MMRKKIILTVMLMLPISISAQEEKFDWSRVIDAIAKVESKGNPKAVSKDCVGVLQIRPVLVQDVNEFLKIKKSKKRFTLKDRFSVEKSKEMFTLYQKRYNPTNNIEKAIRLWNGGCGYSVIKTEKYYQKVLNKMK